MTPGGTRTGTLGRLTATLLVVLGLSLGLALGPASPASAHAYLERTNPADGSALEQAPDHLALYFSEHVVLEATRIELVDSAGVVTELDGLVFATDEPDDTEVPSVVTAVLPELAQDAYLVRWSTLSSDDLHRTAGFFAFGVQTQVAAAGFHEPTPRVVESGLRWLLLLGLALALGSLLVGRLLGALPTEDARSATTRRAARRLRLAGCLGAGAAGLVAILLLVDQVQNAGLSGPDLVASGYAGRWVVREAGLVAVLLALLAGPRHRARRPLLAAGVSLAAIGSALLGHAGADPGAFDNRVAVTALHLLAVLGWAGGVICLAIVAIPAATARGGTPLPVWRLLRSFGRPASAFLVIGVATGLYLTSSTVSSVDAALATTYGRVWLLKVGLVGLMVALAVANHRRLHGPHDLDLPRRGISSEVAAAVLVLAATGVLTSAQPATEPQFQPQPEATAGPVSSVVDDLQVRVGVAPGLPGLNVVSVDVFDTRRPVPGQVTDVSVDVGDGQVYAATSLGDGRWSVPGVDLAAGEHRLLVSVTRPGLRAAQDVTPWTVSSASPRRTVVSTAPLSSLLRTLALLVALLGAAMWWRTRLRERRRGAPVLPPEPASTDPGAHPSLDTGLDPGRGSDRLRVP